MTRTNLNRITTDDCFGTNKKFNQLIIVENEKMILIVIFYFFQLIKLNLKRREVKKRRVRIN